VRNSSHIALCLLALCLATAAAAEVAPPWGNNPNFSQLMTDTKPNVGEVLALTQDHYGFMWIGGKTGLARYDGYRFRMFVNNVKDPHSISASSIRDIFEDSQYRMWLATEGGGVMRYNRELENFDQIPYAPGSYEKTNTGEFFRIMEDSHHNIWFAGNHGVGIWDEKNHNIVQQSTTPEMSDSAVFDIDQVSDDQYVISSTNGIYYWNRRSGKISHFVHDPKQPNSLLEDQARDMLVDAQHNIWITHDKGISRFRPETGDFENFLIHNNNLDIERTPIWSIMQDNKGMLWLTTDGNGIMYFDPVSKTYGSYSGGSSYSALAKPVTRRMYQDRAGDYWIGMYPIGVSHYDSSNNFTKLYNNFARNKEGVFRNQVFAFEENNDGNLWIGIDNYGLTFFDRKKNTFKQSYRGVDFNAAHFPVSVLTLLKDSRGNLWAGSWAQGLVRMDLNNGQYDFYKTAKNGNNKTVFPGTNVWGFMESRDGLIYISTMFNGLVTYDYKTDEFTQLPFSQTDAGENSMSSNIAWMTYEDPQGMIWIATSSGLSIYDPHTRKFRHLTHDPKDNSSLSHNWVTSIFRDSKDRLWLTTMGGGVNLWQPESNGFKHWRTDDGLGTDAIQGIVEDRNGRLWLTTRVGLTSFDPDKNEFHQFTDKNWLQKGEFDTNAYKVLSTGELAFGGVNGFNIFDPAQISTNTYVPPIRFTEFQLFDKLVLADSKESPLQKALLDTDTIELNYDQDVFTLVFSALNYRAWSDNLYQYKLDGFDKDWHEPTTKNRVTYTHMDAGTYQFRVRGSNNSGVWNPEEKVLTIIVNPAPWRTWWAYALYTLIVLSIISWYMHTQREKIRQAALLNAKLLELDRLKDNFMANTSHELRTPVNGILGMVHALKDDVTVQGSAPTRDKLDIIAVCGRRLARLINDILDFSAIKKSQLSLNRNCVNLANIIPNVIAECSAQVSNANITVENQLKTDLPSAFVDEARTTTILYNLISNAFKFTEKGFVRITASHDEHNISISVTDTGVGIDREHLPKLFSSFEQLASSGVHQHNGTGLGLAISKYLAELQGGGISVESTLGVGSIFTVTLPRATEQQLVQTLGSQRPVAESTLKKAAEVHKIDVKLPVFYPKSSTPETVKANKKILVVDDEPVNRMVLRHMLLKRNFTVYEAANGKEMVDAIDEGFRCDLVLLDIMMPKLSGLDACKHVRSYISASEMPIIFITAKTQKQDHDECMAVGGNGFMTKPVDGEDLSARVEAILSVSPVAAGTGTYST
jgi:two-component system sensor histidine kinase ChiS